ncbi:unnamed protein product [Cyprideis torosa]|uniref:Uncharacterized protein n=1 Tax=Cyprideis torosa TaxID=163714 RepID=A0A7R8WKU8_9CRUS|nr:unnamed protein product [Cyprideis torosa]CAG0903640.1 unnamed protein product [Cyprideis torosa]
MARKESGSHRLFHVAVVGLSGTEKDKGHYGSGKSCLCNRFVRPSEDDYDTDHISVLSQTDFAGRVVNNDHFLYWGEVTKESEDGSPVTFSVVEQTEFVDDASFQLFRSGKTEPYPKRCVSTRLQSAEKLMYICKNQLGIEREYEQRTLPDGKFNVDGFVCVFDVSEVPGRSPERQMEQTAAILYNILRAKKPVVLATTKNDEYNEVFLKDAEKLVSRREFKGSIPIVDTSSHLGINVDLAFLTVAQMIDKSRVRVRPMSYAEGMARREMMVDRCEKTLSSLLRTHVTDFRTPWMPVLNKLTPYTEFQNFCSLLGRDRAKRIFDQYVRRLREEYIWKQVMEYLERLPSVFLELLADEEDMDDDWEIILERIKNHEQYSTFFKGQGTTLHPAEGFRKDTQPGPVSPLSGPGAEPQPPSNFPSHCFSTRSAFERRDFPSMTELTVS